MIRKPEIMRMCKELLEWLRCPKCGGPVAVTGSGDALACPACRLFYKIRNGIPVMLVEEAKSMDFCGNGNP